MSRDVAHDGAGSFRVRFPFDRRLVELVKSLPRRRFQAADKTWSVPEDDVVLLVDLLRPEGLSFDDEARIRYADRGGTKTLRQAGESSEADAPNWTVGRLNREVKAVLETAFPQAIWLVGEISGFNRVQHKKHVGFTLIEREATGEQAFQVQAILFDGTRREIERKLAAASNPFRLEDEIEVRVRVRVDLYDAWGAYRVQIEDLDLAFTLGEAARRREEIVRKLAEEGLLERNAVLPLPMLPLRLGLITSLNSDAYHDVLRTLGESGFAFKVTVHGARVQGRATESSLLNALDWFRPRQAHFDAILICRGGGSRTDPGLVRHGGARPGGRSLPDPGRQRHRPRAGRLGTGPRGAPGEDADGGGGIFVDSVRAFSRRVEEHTISIFAEAVALLETEKRARRDAAVRLTRATTRRIESSRAALQASARQLGQGARRDLTGEMRRVRDAASGLAPRVTRALAQEGERVVTRARRLHLLDPRRVVERGYAILRGADGRVILDPAQAEAGARVTAELRNGRLRLVSEGANDD